MAKTKFYGVKVGNKPGVYKTWAECQQQVIGYKGALFKSFPTEREAKEYVEGIVSTDNNNKESNGQQISRRVGKHYDVYVDGSYDDSKKKYSWAFAVYSGAKVIHTANGIGKNDKAVFARNVAGELEATIEAVLWAEKHDVDIITIHHDYIGISEWANGNWKANNDVTQNYACFIKPYLKWVNFKKVVGHTGIEGNELADKLAREALKNICSG